MILRGLAYMSAAWLLLGVAGGARADGPASATGTTGTMDAWANFVLAPTEWKGQVVAEPDAEPRPELGEYLDSDELPLRVHAAPGTPLARVELALHALEAAYRALAARGWPLPFSDGGSGGSLAFDLYLSAAPKRAAYAELDRSLPFVDFDAAQTYAVVDAKLSNDDVPACVTSAFVQAVLHAQDPSEASEVLRASGDFASWAFFGASGCEDSMLRAQRDPERGDVLALLLALLSERHDSDAGSGRFVGALWELTRQRSKGLVKPGILRSSPDLWEAIAATLAANRETWNDDLEELAAARVFAGDARGREHASYRVFAAMPDGASVPLRGDFAYAELPKRVLGKGEGVAELGSSYLRVRTPNVTDDDQLHVWLRGDLGPKWSLIAIRRGADGGEVGRVKTPLRRTPESYLPVQLTRDTAEVVIAVTYLPAKTPDADIPPYSPRGFEVTVDRVLAH